MYQIALLCFNILGAWSMPLSRFTHMKTNCCPLPPDPPPFSKFWPSLSASSTLPDLGRVWHATLTLRLEGLFLI